MIVIDFDTSLFYKSNSGQIFYNQESGYFFEKLIDSRNRNSKHELVSLSGVSTHNMTQFILEFVMKGDIVINKNNLFTENEEWWVVEYKIGDNRFVSKCGNFSSNLDEVVTLRQKVYYTNVLEANFKSMLYSNNSISRHIVIEYLINILPKEKNVVNLKNLTKFFNIKPV